MKVFVKGKGEVTLTQSNFVAEGGQAAVYAKNGTAYKVYTEPRNAIPEAKFAELSRIDDPCVVKPDGLLVEPKTGAPVGYTMRFVKETYTLCQLFPRAFRERNGITQETAHQLVVKLQEHITRVHRAGVLIVDLNELNILATQAFDDLFLIDVDSYQTKGFKAEVIMPSVRDWSVKPEQFSELSDWFSFAVLALQLYVGIHPYRGTHEPSAGVPKDQRLEHRMRHHVSVFNRDVSIPKACYPIAAIPSAQRDWLTAVLEQGKRLPPPDPRGSVVVAVAAPRHSTIWASLTIQELASFSGAVLAYAESGSHSLALTDAGVFLDKRKVWGALPGLTLIGFTPKMARPIGLNLHSGKLTLLEFDIKRQSGLVFAANEIAQSENRFYVRNGAQVLEVEFTETTDKLLVTASHAVANVLEMSSRLFEGCAFQNMLGSAFVSLFPRTRTGYQVRIPELDRYRVMDAKFEGGVLMVCAVKDGLYDRLVFRFADNFSSYDLRVVQGVAPASLNFIVLASGVCVNLTEEEEVEAFSSKTGAVGSKIAKDPGIGSDMRLVHAGGRAGFSRGYSVYSMAMK